MLNLKALHQAHGKVLHRTDLAIAEEMEVSGGFARTHVRNHPRGYKHRTGKLIQATKHKVIRTRRGHVLRIRNTRPYAKALEHGSKPHLIRPKKRSALRFSVGGKLVFAKRVMHPGTKPTRFLFRATQATYRVLGPNLETRIRQAIRRI